jgi:hypothetical protein
MFINGTIRNHIGPFLELDPDVKRSDFGCWISEMNTNEQFFGKYLEFLQFLFNSSR